MKSSNRILKDNEITSDMRLVLEVIMWDAEKGWAEISSGLTSDFQKNVNSFNVRFNDGTQQRISFSIEEI